MFSSHWNFRSLLQLNHCAASPEQSRGGHLELTVPCPAVSGITLDSSHVGQFPITYKDIYLPSSWAGISLSFRPWIWDPELITMEPVLFIFKRTLALSWWHSKKLTLLRKGRHDDNKDLFGIWNDPGFLPLFPGEIT